MAVDQLFASRDLDWHGVSPRLATERRVPLAVVGVAALALLVSAGFAQSFTGGARIVMLGVGTVALTAVTVGWFLVVPRVVQSWRYAERQQDLLVRRGRLFKRLTVVPYGRMQVIEVSAGPVAARLGIATVTLVTASASTDARIPGVPTDIAHELRDRLAAKGEALTAGL